jgi:hypothetical protein
MHCSLASAILRRFVCHGALRPTARSRGRRIEIAMGSGHVGGRERDMEDAVAGDGHVNKLGESIAKLSRKVYLLGL